MAHRAKMKEYFFEKMDRTGNNVIESMKMVQDHFGAKYCPSRATFFNWAKKWKERPLVVAVEPPRDELVKPEDLPPVLYNRKGYLKLTLTELQRELADSILESLERMRGANNVLYEAVKRVRARYNKEIKSVEKAYDDWVMEGCPYSDIDGKAIKVPPSPMQFTIDYGVAVAKLVAPFSKANDTYLSILKQLQVERKDLGTVDKKKKEPRKVEIIRKSGKREEKEDE